VRLHAQGRAVRSEPRSPERRQLPAERVQTRGQRAVAASPGCDRAAMPKWTLSGADTAVLRIEPVGRRDLDLDRFAMHG
jgi:hypothetical protein